LSLKNNFLNFLNKELMSKTFLVSNHITAADIFLYSLAKEQLLEISQKDRLKYIAVLRWAKHLQSLKGLDSLL